jgi:hypothetical protein
MSDDKRSNKSYTVRSVMRHCMKHLGKCWSQKQHSQSCIRIYFQPMLSGVREGIVDLGIYL